MPAPSFYCLLDCEDAEKWKGHEKIAAGMLHHGATWDHFKCWDGELPALDTLHKYCGVLLTGGHYSAYEDRPWINGLAQWLSMAVKQHPKVKFLGICFGCQILARGLGGEAAKNPSGKFVLQVEDIRLSPRLCNDTCFRQAFQDWDRENEAQQATSAAGSKRSSPAPDFDQKCDSPANAGPSLSGQKPLAMTHDKGPVQQPCTAPTPTQRVTTTCSYPALLRLIQSHGDQVVQLPDGAVQLAESDTAPYEIWGWGQNVLAVQGHAELSSKEVMEKIYPAITASGRLTPDEASFAAESLTTTPPDSLLVIHLMRRFMELGLEPHTTDVPPDPGGNGLASQQECCQRTAEESAHIMNLPAAPTTAAATTNVGSMASCEPGNQPGIGETGINGEGGSTADDKMAQAVQALSMGVAAELAAGGPSEMQLLEDCNKITEDHYQQLHQTVSKGNKMLQAVKEQQAAVGPALAAIEALEAQVCQLEGVFAHMEVTASRLQHALSDL